MFYRSLSHTLSLSVILFLQTSGQLGVVFLRCSNNVVKAENPHTTAPRMVGSGTYTQAAQADRQDAYIFTVNRPFTLNEYPFFLDKTQ